MAFSFGTNSNKPTLTLGGSTSNPNPGASFFPKPQLTNPTQSTTSQPPNQIQQQQQQQQTAGTSTTFSQAAIDLTHLRPTTKYDQLIPDLQNEIQALDSFIANSIKHCTEVSDLLPAVINSGTQTAPAIEFVASKLEELETGLENDAEMIDSLRNGELRRDEGEAKCVFRNVDRLRVPRQYQVGSSVDITGNSGTVNGQGSGGGGTGGGVVFGNVGGGLSGWWNAPSSFRGGSSTRGGGGGAGPGGISVQLVDEDIDGDDQARLGGPKTLVELLENRAKEMATLQVQHNQLLGEIEDFVDGLEGKVLYKEREVSDRLEFGMNGSPSGGYNAVQEEREHQMQLLRFVFGEVQRNLYEVAEKVGNTRDGVVDLGLRR